MIRRSQPVYLVLIAAWCLIALWQALEHRRVRAAARAALINRSQDLLYSVFL